MLSSNNKFTLRLIIQIYLAASLSSSLSLCPHRYRHFESSSSLSSWPSSSKRTPTRLNVIYNNNDDEDEDTRTPTNPPPPPRKRTPATRSIVPAGEEALHSARMARSIRRFRTNRGLVKDHHDFSSTTIGDVVDDDDDDDDHTSSLLKVRSNMPLLTKRETPIQHRKRKVVGNRQIPKTTGPTTTAHDTGTSGGGGGNRLLQRRNTNRWNPSVNHGTLEPTSDPSSKVRGTSSKDDGTNQPTTRADKTTLLLRRSNGIDLPYEPTFKALQVYHSKHSDLVMPRRYAVPKHQGTLLL